MAYHFGLVPGWLIRKKQVSAMFLGSALCASDPALFNHTLAIVQGRKTDRSRGMTLSCFVHLLIFCALVVVCFLTVLLDKGETWEGKYVS
jgi:hypothetical protein